MKKLLFFLIQWLVLQWTVQDLFSSPNLSYYSIVQTIKSGSKWLSNIKPKQFAKAFELNIKKITEKYTYK